MRCRYRVLEWYRELILLPVRSSNISKPTLDLVLFNIQLGRSIGKYGSLGLAVSYVATAWVLRKVRHCPLERK